MNFRLRISNQLFHHHAESLVNSESSRIAAIIDALSSEVDFKENPRLNKGVVSVGVTAPSVNDEVRRLFRGTPGIRFEVNESEGVFYWGDQKNGFDFAFLDEDSNLKKLWNNCYGSRPYSDGSSRWVNYVNNMERFPPSTRISEDFARYAHGADIGAAKSSPIILGEIQFGNWALCYRDMFKVLKANIFTNVDLLIYIAADGYLEELLSDGIVTFEKTKNIVTEFSKVLTIPIWVIGIDVDRINPNV